MSKLLPESDERDFDSDDEDFPRLRLLSRVDRAVCRRLADRISNKTLARHFGCSTKTIRRAVMNDYHLKDNLLKDARVLPANWRQLRDKLADDRIVPSEHAKRRWLEVDDRAFIEKFVSDIPLSPAWADTLGKAGYTRKKIRRMAGMPQATVEEFVDRSEVLEKMCELDKFLLVQAIGRFAE